MHRYRLQGDIMQMTETFKQRRETVEKQCGQCRDLFKPWYVFKNFQKTLDLKHVSYNIWSFLYRPSKVVQLHSPNIEADEKLDKTDGITF